jgi:hypothetical protein
VPGKIDEDVDDGAFEGGRDVGVEHMLLTGPAGSRENLRAFARDIMPAFAGSAPAPRRQPLLANS